MAADLIDSLRDGLLAGVASSGRAMIVERAPQLDEQRPEDSALLVAVAAGDRQALGTLYDRYSGVMLGLAIRILGSRREAEDLVQDVFMEAWKRAGDFDPRRGKARTWLLLRLRSRALDRKRSPRLSRRVALDAADRREPAAPDTAAAHFGPDRAKVRAALEALPEEQRVIVLLAYFEGLSSAEIAARVGVPMGTVKSRVAAARKKLRRALQTGVGGAL